MNKIKFRPVGSPRGPVTVVRCSQAKRAIYGALTGNGMGYHTPRGKSKATVEKVMLRNGYVRAGVRA